MDKIETVRSYYNSTVEIEWNRIDGRPEFLLTCRYIDRYVKPGDSVLDIGGGPGRYSMYLAEKGCDVTLFDLSDENVAFAAAKAEELGLPLKTIRGDARMANEIVSGEFDHILLMGPMYHLPEEVDRISAVNACMKLLKTGGTLLVTFISSHAGMIYLLRNAPSQIITPQEEKFMDLIIENKPFSGFAFTENYFARMKDILPFMAQFPLEKLHYFGQEGVLAMNEKSIMSKPAEVYEKWIDMSLALCEREEFLSWSEHLVYVGRKI